jgi:hypothetical protein
MKFFRRDCKTALLRHNTQNMGAIMTDSSERAQKMADLHSLADLCGCEPTIEDALEALGLDISGMDMSLTPARRMDALELIADAFKDRYPNLSVMASAQASIIDSIHAPTPPQNDDPMPPAVGAVHPPKAVVTEAASGERLAVAGRRSPGGA